MTEIIIEIMHGTIGVFAVGMFAVNMLKMVVLECRDFRTHIGGS